MRDGARANECCMWQHKGFSISFCCCLFVPSSVDSTIPYGDASCAFNSTLFSIPLFSLLWKFAFFVSPHLSLSFLCFLVVAFLYQHFFVVIVVAAVVVVVGSLCLSNDMTRFLRHKSLSDFLENNNHTHYDCVAFESIAYYIGTACVCVCVFMVDSQANIEWENGKFWWTWALQKWYGQSRSLLRAVFYFAFLSFFSIEIMCRSGELCCSFAIRLCVCVSAVNCNGMTVMVGYINVIKCDACGLLSQIDSRTTYG